MWGIIRGESRRRNRPGGLLLGSQVGVVCCDMAQVCAHITGTVWKILVKVGDSVAVEQPLVILESMKMEMPVEAADPGTVARIAVTEGQAVEEGDVLVELT